VLDPGASMISKERTGEKAEAEASGIEWKEKEAKG
jgi:hypothetical protein